MAGSPQYLKELNKIEQTLEWFNDHKITENWDQLDEAWAELEKKPTPIRLAELAEEAFLLYTSLTGKTAGEVIDNAKALHIAKNAGYAGADNPDPWANFRMCEVFGITAYDGVLVRLSDKYIRTQNLRKDPTNERVGESLLDTLADLGAYCLIGICIAEE